MNGAAAAAASVTSSNISATVSTPALPAGRLPFPSPQSQHHHPLHAAGAAGPSLLHLNHPAFAQTASLLAASRPNHTLSPQLIVQAYEQAHIQRHYQQQMHHLMNTSPTSMATTASNPSPAPSDASAAIPSTAPITPSSAPTSASTSSTITTKPKIWSIADVATSEDRPKKETAQDSAPKMEPKSGDPQRPPVSQQKQNSKEEDAARSDGIRWMDQLMQQRNHPHLTPQQIQQFSTFGMQPQLNGITSSAAAMYSHHPVFGGISSANIRLPTKSLTSTPLYGLAELLSAQEKSTVMSYPVVKNVTQL